MRIARPSAQTSLLKGFLVLAALTLSSPSSAQRPARIDLAKSPWPVFFEEAYLSDFGEARVVADGWGIRKKEVMVFQPFSGTQLDVSFSESLLSGFNSDLLRRTVESLMDLAVSIDLGSDGVFHSRVRSFISGQDLRAFTSSDSPDRLEDRSYSILGGWRRDLGSLSIDLSLGAVLCIEPRAGDFGLSPLVGFRLSRGFGWGDISALLGQDVRDADSRSGLYGSQISRHVSIEGSFRLAEGARLLWSCTMAAASGAFSRTGVLACAPVVTAGAGLEFDISETLTASVHFGHRDILAASRLDRGPEGPSGAASFTYLF